MNADNTFQDRNISKKRGLSGMESLGNRLWETLGYISHYLSGEFLLNKRVNGGDVVLVRSVMVSILIYVLALALKSYTDKYSVLAFSAERLREAINETIPWLGAIFAGTYASLYSRFSNQWAYLASIYNQIKEVESSLLASDKNKTAIASWKAGFISDAYTLHLDQKAIFSGYIASILEEEDVLAAVLENFNDEYEKADFLARHRPKQPSGEISP